LCGDVDPVPPLDRLQEDPARVEIRFGPTRARKSEEAALRREGSKRYWRVGDQVALLACLQIQHPNEGADAFSGVWEREHLKGDCTSVR
jgi:hypothetical protein